MAGDPDVFLCHWCRLHIRVVAGWLSLRRRSRHRRRRALLEFVLWHLLHLRDRLAISGILLFANPSIFAPLQAHAASLSPHGVEKGVTVRT